LSGGLVERDPPPRHLRRFLHPHERRPHRRSVAKCIRLMWMDDFRVMMQSYLAALVDGEYGAACGVCLECRSWGERAHATLWYIPTDDEFPVHVHNASGNHARTLAWILTAMVAQGKELDDLCDIVCDDTPFPTLSITRTRFPLDSSPQGKPVEDGGDRSGRMID